MSEFRILGPLEVIDEGKAVALGGQKQRALLAILLISAGEVVSTDRLLAELWGEHPPRTAREALQNLVSQLRKVLRLVRSSRGLPATGSSSKTASSTSGASSSSSRTQKNTMPGLGRSFSATRSRSGAAHR